MVMTPEEDREERMYNASRYAVTLVNFNWWPLVVWAITMLTFFMLVPETPG